MAISVGATWVGRGFSGDPKSLSALIVLAVKHHGFSFLNVVSPCVTFRGDNQMKKLREIVRTVPEEHDRTDRGRSVKYTRETGVLTTGVLYEVEQPSLEDRLASLRKMARGDQKEPTVSEILETFYPNC
jgi:2-oxoglutarate ferredoxin oxidoreductase subunit beta